MPPLPPPSTGNQIAGGGGAGELGAGSLAVQFIAEPSKDSHVVVAVISIALTLVLIFNSSPGSSLALHFLSYVLSWNFLARPKLSQSSVPFLCLAFASTLTRSKEDTEIDDQPEGRRPICLY